MSEAQVKAYDVKVLTEKLKARGLDLAEEAATIIVEETFNWVAESAPISKTPYDDMLMVVIPPVKKMILTEVDKIDGQEG